MKVHPLNVHSIQGQERRHALCDKECRLSIEGVLLGFRDDIATDCVYVSLECRTVGIERRRFFLFPTYVDLSRT